MIDTLLFIIKLLKKYQKNNMQYVFLVFLL